MSLLKAKQLDMNDLATALSQVLSENSALAALFKPLFEPSFQNAIFNSINDNITMGQTAFVITYAVVPTTVFVYRNGLALANTTDYTTTQNSGSFTITLATSITDTNETLQINYY